MINADKPQLWNEDTRKSVLQYNDWFMTFAPEAYQEARENCLNIVSELFASSNNILDITPKFLMEHPRTMMTLRMLCVPPIACDRLAGLAGLSRNRIKGMEQGRLPQRNLADFENNDLPALLRVILLLLDRHLMPWLNTRRRPTNDELMIAKSVVADRLTGSTSDPVIRNAQEARQLNAIAHYLTARGYRKLDDKKIGVFDMPHGTFAYHKNVAMFKNALDDSDGYVNTPVDVVIMPLDPAIKRPLFVECKSAGDFANTNKRRKEEDTKVTQLRATYGPDTTLYLFLCGYFDSTYLGYEAANHMDWVWEHRIKDFEQVGV